MTLFYLYIDYTKKIICIKLKVIKYTYKFRIEPNYTKETGKQKNCIANRVEPGPHLRTNFEISSCLSIQVIG